MAKKKASSIKSGSKKVGRAKATTKGAKSGGAIGRNSETGRFVLGHDAFVRISAVEGVVLTKPMKADLRRLKDAAPAHRRFVLAGKYGKT